MDVLVRITGAILGVHIPGNNKLYLTATGGLNFLTGLDCPDETGRNDFIV